MLYKSKIARRWEMNLEKEIFWGEEMGDDKPVEPLFNVTYTVSPDDWGVEAVYHKTDEQGSYVWENSIKDYRTDLQMLRSPPFSIDWEKTNGFYLIRSPNDWYETTIPVFTAVAADSI